ncbi:MAG: outer membrane lipoprotein-sorting protein [Polyangiaceae bacterium]|nr:outer membrane lipoprotein-sorting protein [Polyangiaceae bacterium]
MSVSRLVPILLISLLWIAPAHAGLSGKQIAEKMESSNGFSWEGAKIKTRMILKKGKSKSVRQMRLLGRKVEGRSETVIRFTSPQKIAGTAFLMLETKSGKDHQHIYLPGLKKRRRISGRERNGSFMGSDFTYADLRGMDATRAVHERLKDDKVGTVKTYVIVSKMKPSAKSNYSKVQTWVRKNDFVPMRTKFFDKKGRLMKTMYTKKVETIEGQKTITKSLMKSENGHSTELIIDDVDIRKNLKDSQFTPSAIEH